MKKVVDVNIGRVNFSMDDDAYLSLRSYLNRFEASVIDKNDVPEIMEDIENRVAEIFTKSIKYLNQVVDQKMVDVVIGCLGEIEDGDVGAKYSESQGYAKGTVKKLYRNPDDKKIAGVCSGLAIYLNVDVALVRVLFIIALVCFGSAFLIYVVLWIIIPLAKTVIQKLEMRGESITSENIRKYSYRN